MTVVLNYKKMLISYANSAFAQFILAVALVGNGVSPISFTSDQWADVANVLWTALIPVLVRYLNKKDPAFGRIAEPILKDVKKKTVKKIRKTK